MRYGPPGFDVYVRIAFPSDDQGERVDVIGAALATLAPHTVTPHQGYAAVWEGWGGNPPHPRAPRVHIPNREMLLFTGHVSVLKDAPALAWGESGSDVAPHLLWPEDQSWCLACEVDEEIEFTVGCSTAAAEALVRAFPDDARRVLYGEDVPLYLNDGE